MQFSNSLDHLEKYWRDDSIIENLEQLWMPVKTMVLKEKKTSYDEVIGYWLENEYHGRKELREHVDARFSEDLSLISTRDYDNDASNLKRYEMLASYRPFLEYFKDAEWWSASIGFEELGELTVIHAAHWEELSRGSLKAIDIAKTIHQNPKKLLTSYNSRRVKKILDNLERKVADYSRMVVVTGKEASNLVVIDGVHRAIRLCLYYLVQANQASNQREFEIFFGISSGVTVITNPRK